VSATAPHGATGFPIPPQPQPTTLSGKQQASNNPSRSVLDTSADSLSKGDRAVILGRLRSRSWETPEGDKRSVVEVEADEVAPSLRWAIAKPERATKNGDANKAGQFNDDAPF
jgi:single-stranded DNA-binding protein